VLLLWAEHDRLVPPAHGKAYQEHLPQAQWQMIPGAGHLSMFEKEAAFVEAVAAFARG
jgi:pimeloyl-ACP methyl ester carboxylesterase